MADPIFVSFCERTGFVFFSSVFFFSKVTFLLVFISGRTLDIYSSSKLLSIFCFEDNWRTSNCIKHLLFWSTCSRKDVMNRLLSARYFFNFSWKLPASFLITSSSIFTLQKSWLMELVNISVLLSWIKTISCFWSSYCGSSVRNLTSIHEDAVSIPGLA